jgi:hypothetical protein
VERFLRGSWIKFDFGGQAEFRIANKDFRSRPISPVSLGQKMDNFLDRSLVDPDSRFRPNSDIPG